MSNILNNFYVQSNQPLDKKWGPYNSIEECLLKLPGEIIDENSGEKLTGVRYQGLTVGILQEDKTIKEYWFCNGIEDKHLVEKTIELPENTDNGLPEGYYIATFLYNEQHMNSILTDYDGFIKLPENQFVNDGYKISGWQIDNDNDNIFAIGENIKLSQNTIFIPRWEELKKYEITIQSYDNETIKPCVENEIIEIVAEDEEGYSFIKWDDGNTDNPRTITVTENKVYSAEYKINSYAINVKSSNYDFGTVFGGGVFNYNTEIIITPIPKEGYSFIKWDDGNTDNPRLITVTEDKVYSAEFEINKYTIDVKSSNDNFGTVFGGGEFDYNSNIEIKAENKEYCSFIKWDDGNTDNPRLITVTEDKDYIAIFSENWYVVPGDFNNNNFEIKDEDLLLVNENPVIIPSKNFNNGNGIILIPKKLSAEYFNFIDTMGNTVEMEKVDKPPVTSNTQVYTKLNENDNQIEKQINGLNYIGYGICIGSNTFTGIEIKTKLNNVEK